MKKILLIVVKINNKSKSFGIRDVYPTNVDLVFIKTFNNFHTAKVRVFSELSKKYFAVINGE